MKRITAIAFALFAAAPLEAQVAADSAIPISLDEAIDLARRNSPAAIQARGTERTSRAAVRSAYGAFIPNLTITAGRTRQWNDQPTTSFDPRTGEQLTGPTTYNAGLTFNATLFEGRRLYDLSSARATVSAAEALQVTQEFQVALNVSQQYFNALAARESEAAARAQLEQAQQQLRFSATRVRAGVATKSDSLRSLIQVGNAQLALLQAQTALRGADATLSRLIGSDRTVTAAPGDSTLAPLGEAMLDTGRLSRLALEGPAVRQARANLEAARATRRAATGAYLPTLTATYSRNGSGIDQRFGLGDQQYRYRGQLDFRVSYPLFNGFQREQTVVQADVAEDNAQAALRDAELLARQTLVQNLDQLRTAQTRVEVGQLSVFAAREDLRVQQQRYQAGASTLLDVLTSQTQLREAESALIQARLDARVARAQLEALIGRPLAEVSR